MRLIDADELKERIRKALGIKSLDNLLPSEKTIVNQIDMASTIQPEPCEDAVSRLEIIRNLHKYFKEGFEQDKWWNSGHVIHAIMDAPSVTPNSGLGKWILDRSGAYCCSECMEPCAGYVMMKPRDKFCKMCGAKMEVTE